MKQNTKTVVLTLLATTIIAAGATFASEVNTSSTGSLFGKKQELTTEQKAQFEAIKTILDKKKAGTSLTADEQSQLDEFQLNNQKMGLGRGEVKHGKGGERGEIGQKFGEGFGGLQMQLTDEEKKQLESMTDAEKQTFYETKRTQMEAKKEAHETVIDKLLAGTTLTADEETLRQEIIKERTQMKEKKEEMKAMKTIMDKKRNGETLTADEQTQLDTFEDNKAEMGEKGFGGKKMR